MLEDTVIEAGAAIRNSVVGRGVTIGADARLDGVAVGDGAVIGARNELLGGARVWPGAVLAECSVRFSSDA